MAIGFHAQQDLRLQRVRVLVFVDQNMVEPLSHEPCQRGLTHHLRPIEQQIIVVEDVITLLRCDIAAEEFLQFSLPL